MSRVGAARTRFDVIRRRGLSALTNNEVRVVFAMTVHAATACIFALLTARWLGPTDRGVLVVVVTTASFLMLVGSLGIGTGGRVLLNAAPPLRITRFLEIAHRLSMVHILTAAAVGLPVLALTHGLPDWWIGLVFIPYAVGQLLAYLQREAMHGIGRHAPAVFGDVLTATVQTVLVVALWLLGRLDLHLACLTMLVGITAQTIFLEACLRKTALRESRCEPQSSFAEVARFSLPAVANILGQAFVIRGDRLVLGALATSGAVGIYGVAGTFTELLWLIPGGVAQIVFRRASLRGARAEYRRKRNVTLLCTLCLGVAMASCAHWIIPLLLGYAYIGAVEITYLLIVASLPMASYQLDVAVLNGLGRLKYAGFTTTIGTAVLVVGCLLLIPVWGAMGAAVASLVAYTALAIVARLGCVSASRSTTWIDEPTTTPECRA
jgi:O-antigen/teichoic acid export membrane protein